MQLSSSALKIVIPVYRWHTQMFGNLTKDITEEQAHVRIEGRTNNIVWAFGNLVNCRYWLANVLGLSETDPNDSLFSEGKAFDAAATYPSLEELKSLWLSISQKVYDRLLSTTDEELNEPFDFGMKVEFVEENKLNMVGMAIDRTSYLLGQVALLRRAVANVGTSYDVDSSINY